MIKEANTYYCEIKNQIVVYMLSSSVEDFNNQAKKYPFVAGFLSKPLKISHLENILKDNFVKVKPLDGLVVRSYEKVKK